MASHRFIFLLSASNEIVHAKACAAFLRFSRDRSIFNQVESFPFAKSR